MPIYEYRCGGCRRRVSIFFRSLSSVTEPVCPRCGSRELTRLMSRVAVHRAAVGDDGGDLDDLGGAFAGLDENDPRAMAQALRQMSDETGEPLEPEMEEALGRLEAGEDPERVLGEMDDTAPADDEDLDAAF